MGAEIQQAVHNAKPRTARTKRVRKKCNKQWFDNQRLELLGLSILLESKTQGRCIMTDQNPRKHLIEKFLTSQISRGTYVLADVLEVEEDDNNPQEGGETELLCSCGGPLVKYEPVRQRIQESIAAVGKQRYARTKRLQKKHHKQWVEKHHQTLMMGLIVGAIGPPQFRCKSCRRIIGFYETVARNIFRVEPLPPGALPIFTKEP